MLQLGGQAHRLITIGTVDALLQLGKQGVAVHDGMVVG